MSSNLWLTLNNESADDHILLMIVLLLLYLLFFLLIPEEVIVILCFPSMLSLAVLVVTYGRSIDEQSIVINIDSIDLIDDALYPMFKPESSIHTKSKNDSRFLHDCFDCSDPSDFSMYGHAIINVKNGDSGSRLQENGRIKYRIDLTHSSAPSDLR
jgi:hypothetical protein